MQAHSTHITQYVIRHYWRPVLTKEEEVLIKKNLLRVFACAFKKKSFRITTTFSFDIKKIWNLIYLMGSLFVKINKKSGGVIQKVILKKLHNHDDRHCSLHYTASAGIQPLPCKWRWAIVSAEISSTCSTLVSRAMKLGTALSLLLWPSVGHVGWWSTCPLHIVSVHGVRH